MLHRWFQALLEQHMRRIVARYHRALVLASVVLTALAVWVMATRWNINADLKALLPESSPAAQAMEEVSARVGSGSSLFVVVDSPDQEATLAFAKDYTARLRQMDPIALAHYHNDKTFFERHQLLYMEAEDIAELRERVASTIKQRKKEANPLFVSLKKKDEGAGLEVDDLEHKYQKRMAHTSYKEHLFSDDGYALTIMVRFVESSTDMTATNALIDRVKGVSDELEPSSYHPELTVDYGGGLANRQKQYESIVDDIQSSAVFTILGIFALLGLYFRRARAVLLVLTPLLMGVCWTLAGAFLIYGELTVITVFIFAVLLGLGIDFAIHILHGYDRARAEDEAAPVEALVSCARSTGLATSLGAVTTLATFLVLTMADFKSLSQFGAVASVGVLATLVATLVVLPSLVLTLHQLRPASPHAPPRASVERRRALLERWLRRLAPASLLGVIVVTAALGRQIPELGFEENFYRIGTFYWPWEDRPDLDEQFRTRGARVRARDLAGAVARSAERVRRRVDPETYVRERVQTSTGSKYTSALQNQTSSNPTILLFDDPARAEAVTRRAERELGARERPSISSVMSIYSFLPGTPDEQRARMGEIQELEELLAGESLSFLKKAERERIERLRDKLDVAPVTVRDLPEWTKRFFKEAGPEARPPTGDEDFTYDQIIIATPRQRTMDGPEARRYLSDLKQVAGAPDEQGYRLASQAYVYVTMLDEIQSDGLRMILIALGVVLLLLTLALRNPLRALVAMIPLAIGGVWTLGVASWLGMRLDFFNIVILPALIGIGVDDGVHFYMRYLERGRGLAAGGLAGRGRGDRDDLADLTDRVRGAGDHGLRRTPVARAAGHRGHRLRAVDDDHRDAGAAVGRGVGARRALTRPAPRGTMGAPPHPITRSHDPWQTSPPSRPREKTRRPLLRVPLAASRSTRRRRRSRSWRCICRGCTTSRTCRWSPARAPATSARCCEARASSSRTSICTPRPHPMNAYSKFFANQLGFKNVEVARESVELIDTMYHQFATGGDRAGQHHAMMMAMTMGNRAFWTGKHAEATAFRDWLIARLQDFNHASLQALEGEEEE